MPPKLRLALDSMLPRDSLVAVPVRDSMQCTDNGTLRVFSKSMQEYTFNAEGMTRGNAKLLNGDQPYKVSSRKVLGRTGVVHFVHRNRFKVCTLSC